MFLLAVTAPAEANNAFDTASHLPALDDAAPLDASKPLPTLDANSIILILILLAVTYNATKSSANTRNWVPPSQNQAVRPVGPQAKGPGPGRLGF